MFTGIPLIDLMYSVILGAVYAIIFAVAFLFGFLETAIPGQLIPW